MSNIPIGTRVELIDGKVAGWTGVIRDKKPEEALVEWDHGEAWTWTLERRLRALSVPVSRLIEEAQSRRDAEKCPTCGSEEDPRLAEIDKYAASIEGAFEAALDSDGFFLITVKTMPHPEDPNLTAYIPNIYGGCLDPRTVDIVEAQIAIIAAEHHQRLIIEHLKRNDEPGR